MTLRYPVARCVGPALFLGQDERLDKTVLLDLSVLRQLALDRNLGLRNDQRTRAGMRAILPRGYLRSSTLVENDGNVPKAVEHISYRKPA